jgi:hypothetical protein
MSKRVPRAADGCLDQDTRLLLYIWSAPLRGAEEQAVGLPKPTLATMFEVVTARKVYRSVLDWTARQRHRWRDRSSTSAAAGLLAIDSFLVWAWHPMPSVCAQKSSQANEVLLGDGITSGIPLQCEEAPEEQKASGCTVTNIPSYGAFLLYGSQCYCVTITMPLAFRSAGRVSLWTRLLSEFVQDAARVRARRKAASCCLGTSSKSPMRQSVR